MPRLADPPVVGFFKSCFREQLEVTGRASPLARLLTSKHTRDLRVVFIVACAVILAFVPALIAAPSLKEQGTSPVPLLSTITSQPFLNFIGIGALSGAVTWAYQSASKRLGTVDL